MSVIEDLRYHSIFLDSLGCDSSCKIILHIGGVYLDKPVAMERFIRNFENLTSDIKKRLIIENNDKSYNIEDVLYISDMVNILIVL